MPTFSGETGLNIQCKNSEIYMSSVVNVADALATNKVNTRVLCDCPNFVCSKICYQVVISLKVYFSVLVIFWLL